jgi:hypothetical protein
MKQLSLTPLPPPPQSMPFDGELSATYVCFSQGIVELAKVRISE